MLTQPLLIHESRQLSWRVQGLEFNLVGIGRIQKWFIIFSYKNKTQPEIKRTKLIDEFNEFFAAKLKIDTFWK